MNNLNSTPSPYLTDNMNITQSFEKRLKIYQESYFQQDDNINDNFWEKIKYNTKNWINKTFEDFIEYKKMENTSNVDINNIERSEEIKIFEIHIEKVRDSLLNNFSNMLDTHNNIKSILVKKEEFLKAVKSLETINLVASSDNEAKIKNVVKDIEIDLEKHSQIDNLLKQYDKYYLKHCQYIKSFRKINCLNSIPLCTICLQNHIDSVIIPCGHTFCKNCCYKMMGKCGICRENIIKQQKIYIL